jgi:hypothetical protein
MSCETIQQNHSDFHPDFYEGSYKDIFTNLNFNFSVLKDSKSTKKVGRPKFSRYALFGALVLKFLALNSSYRTIEAMLDKDPELADLIGFSTDHIPSDSTLRQFFSEITLNDLYEVNKELLSELQALGYAQGTNIALDSTPIEAFCRLPTKKNPTKKDPDAKWGYAKCKNGKYLGYKAQVVVDIDDYLPIYFIITPANVSDQKMVDPFITPIKDMGIRPKIALLDAGYDSEDNHLILREKLGCISLISPNKRRDKRTFSSKLVKYNKKLLYQTKLDKYIPTKLRKKKYRKCCLVLQDKKEYKKHYRKRVAVEQFFATLKKDLFLEDHKLMGLENISKHTAMKCLCMLIIAFAAIKMGVPEAMRSPKFFQH